MLSVLAVPHFQRAASKAKPTARHIHDRNLYITDTIRLEKYNYLDHHAPGFRRGRVSRGAPTAPGMMPLPLPLRRRCRRPAGAASSGAKGCGGRRRGGRSPTCCAARGGRGSEGSCAERERRGANKAAMVSEHVIACFVSTHVVGAQKSTPRHILNLIDSRFFGWKSNHIPVNSLSLARQPHALARGITKGSVTTWFSDRTQQLKHILKPFNIQKNASIALKYICKATMLPSSWRCTRKRRGAGHPSVRNRVGRCRKRTDESRVRQHKSPGHIEIPQLRQGGQPPTNDQRRFTVKAVVGYSTKVGRGRGGS